MKGIPYTEADIAQLRRIAEEQNSQTVQAAIDRRWLATLDAARDRPGLDVESIKAAVEAAHPEPKYKDDSHGEGWTWHGIKRGREHVYEALAEAQQREGG